MEGGDSPFPEAQSNDLGLATEAAQISLCLKASERI